MIDYKFVFNENFEKKIGCNIGQLILIEINKLIFI